VKSKGAEAYLSLAREVIGRTRTVRAAAAAALTQHNPAPASITD
jgi:hypothetical protein